VVTAENKLDADKLLALGKKEPKAVKFAEIEGARQAFRKVAVLPVVLFVIFAGIAYSDRARGGYKPEELAGKEFTGEELASDY
jgi:hypothetical protein